MASELELFEKYVQLRTQKTILESDLKAANKEVDMAQAQLIEYLEGISATATAKYDGLGYAKVMKPRLYASCRMENKPALMEHLKKEGRSDLIKTDVHAASLSGYVSERMENGESIPDYLDYYLKPQLRLFK